MEQEKRLRYAELLLRGLTVDEAAELTKLIIEERDEHYELKQVKKLNIDDVSNSFYCQTKRGCTKQCDECALIELNPPF